MDNKGQAFTCSLAQKGEKGDLGTKKETKRGPNPQKGPQGDPGTLKVKGTQLGTVLLAYCSFQFMLNKLKIL